MQQGRQRALFRALGLLLSGAIFRHALALPPIQLLPSSQRPFVFIHIVRPRPCSSSLRTCWPADSISATHACQS